MTSGIVSCYSCTLHMSMQPTIINNSSAPAIHLVKKKRMLGVRFVILAQGVRFLALLKATARMRSVVECKWHYVCNVFLCVARDYDYGVRLTVVGACQQIEQPERRLAWSQSLDGIRSVLVCQRTVRCLRPPVTFVRIWHDVFTDNSPLMCCIYTM